jgi:hypothetical protein
MLKHSNFQLDLNFAAIGLYARLDWLKSSATMYRHIPAVQQSSIAYPGQRKCIQYPYRDVGWWKRGNPVISPYSAFYYWSRTSCVIWRRSDTLSVWQCVLYVSAAISVVPVEGLCQPSSVRHTVCGMSSAVLRVYQHNFTSTHQSVHHLCMWHCRYLVYQCRCSINTPPIYQCFFLSVHLSYIRLSLCLC